MTDRRLTRCHSCGGAGKTIELVPRVVGGLRARPVFVTCPDCNGTGRIDWQADEPTQFKLTGVPWETEEI